MIVSEVTIIALKFPDSAFFTASQTWTILFGSRSLLRYATSHFLSCFPSELLCGVYNWNSLHMCGCDGAIVILRPHVSFFYHQPSRWIKLSESFQNVLLETCLPFVQCLTDFSWKTIHWTCDTMSATEQLPLIYPGPFTQSTIQGKTHVCSRY